MARVLHMRLISPAPRTAEAIAVLEDCQGVTNIVLVAGAARTPPGDLVLCDVARESANEVIGRLGWLESEGSIAVETVDLSISAVSDTAKDAAPGDGDDAVVWAGLAQRVYTDSRMTWSYFIFLAIATQLAAIGVLQNSPILIVGAMVLGPEFGAVAAICFGLMHTRAHLVIYALKALIIGFGVAIAITFVCVYVSTWLGWVTPEMLDHDAEVQFIVKPDRWSFIVALLAGAAGVLSITSSKSTSLVGVFISVTTVPAAGFLAVALALGRWSDVSGSVVQLTLNIAGMVVAGTATLVIQRRFWPQSSHRG